MRCNDNDGHKSEGGVEVNTAGRDAPGFFGFFAGRGRYEDNAFGRFHYEGLLGFRKPLGIP